MELTLKTLNIGTRRGGSIEKQSPLFESPYLMKTRPHSNDWLRSIRIG